MEVNERLDFVSRLCPSRHKLSSILVCKQLCKKIVGFVHGVQHNDADMRQMPELLSVPVVVCTSNTHYHYQLDFTNSSDPLSCTPLRRLGACFCRRI